jgi:hypothetical protein
MDLENQFGKKNKVKSSFLPPFPPIRPAGPVSRAGPLASPSARAPFLSPPPLLSLPGPAQIEGNRCRLLLTSSLPPTARAEALVRCSRLGEPRPVAPCSFTPASSSPPAMERRRGCHCFDQRQPLSSPSDRIRAIHFKSNGPGWPIPFLGDFCLRYPRFFWIPPAVLDQIQIPEIDLFKFKISSIYLYNCHCTVLLIKSSF